MYWRIPPGYPYPFPGAPWFSDPSWPYRWRKPLPAKEMTSPQTAPPPATGDTEPSTPANRKEEGPTQPKTSAPPLPDCQPDPTPPASREPVQAEEDKKGKAGAKASPAGPLKWHFPP